MRKAMIGSVSEMIRSEQDTSLFLVDIGVWAFRDILKNYPERALNIGIFEDGMISVAAGMALQGMIPTIYGISPFIVERALEQLKLDFAYQGLGGNFITTGAVYDFSSLGYSHYCPEDLGIIKMIPGFEFVAPGAPQEFSSLFSEAHRNGHPTYYRLSDHCNTAAIDVNFGKANIIRSGNKATVIAVGTMLDMVMSACKNEDVTVLYYTTLLPFDYDILKKNYNNGRILLCEPHYEGTLSYEVYKAFEGEPICLRTVGIRREILRNYGSKEENDIYNRLTVEQIKRELNLLIN